MINIIYIFSDVSIVSYSACETLLCPSYEELQGYWVNSAPVCASNGFTYGDVHQVRCLKDFMPCKCADF